MFIQIKSNIGIQCKTNVRITAENVLVVLQTNAREILHNTGANHPSVRHLLSDRPEKRNYLLYIL